MSSEGVDEVVQVVMNIQCRLHNSELAADPKRAKTIANTYKGGEGKMIRDVAYGLSGCPGEVVLETCDKLSPHYPAYLAELKADATVRFPSQEALGKAGIEDRYKEEAVDHGYGGYQVVVPIKKLDLAEGDFATSLALRIYDESMSKAEESMGFVFLGDTENLASRLRRVTLNVESFYKTAKVIAERIGFDTAKADYLIMAVAYQNVPEASEPIACYLGAVHAVADLLGAADWEQRVEQEMFSEGFIEEHGGISGEKAAPWIEAYFSPENTEYGIENDFPLDEAIKWRKGLSTFVPSEEQPYHADFSLAVADSWKSAVGTVEKARFYKDYNKRPEDVAWLIEQGVPEKLIHHYVLLNSVFC